MAILSKHLVLGPALKISPWRKVAIGTWCTAKDPSVYAMVELNVGPAEAYIEKAAASSGKRITMTHFVGKAVAETVRRNPEINCVLRWGRLYPRQDISLFFQVATDEKGEDLTGVTIHKAHEKSIVDMASQMGRQLPVIRKHKDDTYKKMKSMFSLIPGWLSRWVLDITGFILYTLNIWSPLFGAPKNSLGSVMITNIGSLGLEMAFAPLVPYSRVPMVIAVGATQERPVVENNQVRVARMLKLCVTFDHRVIDGVHGSKLAKTIQTIFANPEVELEKAS
ncbi:MAG: 2-oxo acid dehydrogenase subunit E2 [Deltaproteobacteria bacterium]|nr:2-oxo acid dehydrogenase subunit E2 [Deltaproteobacteria bacterium]